MLPVHLYFSQQLSDKTCHAPKAELCLAQMRSSCFVSMAVFKPQVKPGACFLDQDDPGTASASVANDDVACVLQT
jgi:hypothetical protein